MNTKTKRTPMILVGSIVDHNNGILHGEWIDATASPDSIRSEIARILASSPTAAKTGEPAEEWGILDTDGFGPHQLVRDWENLEATSAVARNIAEYGEAFAAWCYIFGVCQDGDQTEETLSDGFIEQFVGEYESLEEFALQLLDDLGANEMLAELPEWLRPYVTIDVEGFAECLIANGEFTVEESETGTVFVFYGS